MHRLLGTLALLASVAVLGCSAAGVEDEDDPNEPGLGAGGLGGSLPDGGGDPGGTGGVGGSGAGGSGAGGTGTGGSADECPAGVICVGSLPYTDSNTTADGAAVLDGYGCAPTVNEAGPEKVYRVDLAKAGLLAASLDNLGVDVDVDVHILHQLDAGACVDRGHWDAAALLEPGRFWVVVDSWVDGSQISHEGSYELTLALTSADRYVAEGLSASVLDAGLRAFDLAWAYGDTVELEYGIIDYTMPSIEPRFFVLDLRRGQLLYAELASHGEGSQDPSDLKLTGSMSNLEGSHASSVGLVRTAETYWGSNGYSLRLDGLEPGFNDNDRPRAIVVHGADYATQDFVNAYGYLGRSWGCPATDPLVVDELIDTMADGRLILKYFDDPIWLGSSGYVAP